MHVVSSPVTSPAPPAGWYPDPWRQSWWRWWDGHHWTGYTEQWFMPAEPDPTGAVRAGGIAVLGFLVGIALSIAIDVPLLLAGFSVTDPAVLLGSTIGLWIGLGGSCVVAVRRNGSGSLRDLGLVRPRWVDLWLGLGLGVATLIAVGIVAAILSLLDPSFTDSGGSQFGDPVNDSGVLGVVVIYLIAVVGAPFFEELYFRGLVQGTLTARWGVAIGLVVQAALFALVHLTPDAGLGNVGIYVVILTVGVGLGAIRRLTGRLPPAMLTHATYNAIIVTLIVAGVANG
jgi:membrane protease YdiL (CAAX protease family)